MSIDNPYWIHAEKMNSFDIADHAVSYLLKKTDFALTCAITDEFKNWYAVKASLKFMDRQVETFLI